MISIISPSASRNHILNFLSMDEPINFLYPDLPDGGSTDGLIPLFGLFLLRSYS